MATTAQLRSEAYSAEQRRDWAAAADFYEQAVAVYPAHDSRSALAIKDKAGLVQRAKSARAIAANLAA